jgi:flagellar motor switch protein FliN/FliY
MSDASMDSEGPEAPAPMASQPPPAAPSAPPPAGADAGLAGNDLDRILDIPLDIHVELGRRKMRIEELLGIDVGSVVELGTPAGTPLSIYANRVLVAQGEAVIVGERYGVRITDIVPAGERVRRLGGKEAM